ncbi:hypothetical protein [Candidatus Methylomirabilis sp.]|uniref:hypothetical protein n=1 Tax=Candidatus Methylomirabilis sp. TaxID=2032687 RepID=UPI002A5B73D3|nr:hypothetical protein [Candidatus Methylomirabilis sp.]
MVALGGLGVVGLYFSATWHSRSQAQLRDDAITDVSSAFRNLSYEQAEKIKNVLTKWGERVSREEFGPILLRDGAIALLIAVFITVTIELYAARRLRMQVAQDVLSGVFNKIIPEEIFEEVKSQVIQATALRRDWKIKISLSKDVALNKPGYDLYVSTTILSFGIENLLSQPQRYPLSSGLSLDITGTDSEGKQLPRYEKVTVGSDNFVGEKLASHLSQEGVRLSMPIDLPSRIDGMVESMIVIKEIIRVPDAFNWVTPMVADGATIDIDTTATPDLSFTIEAYHPNKKKLKETIAGQRWVFSEGMLPWQGFEVEVKKKA